MTNQAYQDLCDAAVWAGGEVGGVYLDGIKKTDLAELTKEEYFNFLKIVDQGREEYMREHLEEKPG